MDVDTRKWSKSFLGMNLISHRVLQVYFNISNFTQHNLLVYLFPFYSRIDIRSTLHLSISTSQSLHHSHPPLKLSRSIPLPHGPCLQPLVRLTPRLLLAVTRAHNI
jgi:hypothetical protein